MKYPFRPAVRENVNLLIGLAGGTGSGKTFTGMRLASGIARAMYEAGLTKMEKFAVIDTENGRARHYADQFRFDVADLRAPFSPASYKEAILAADAAGYPVVMVDSTSHEHAGEGGILDMQEAEYQRLGARDAVKLLSWAKPKAEHKDFVSALLQVKAHLILCFRAEPKIEMAKDDKGKTVIVPKKSLVGLDGWIPISEKNLPFELTVSLMFTPDQPGIPKPIKLQQQHRALFPLDRVVDEASGRGVALWAAGGAPKKTAEAPRQGADPATAATDESSREAPASEAAYITADQEIVLLDLARELGVPLEKLARAAKVEGVGLILSEDYEPAKAWLEKHRK